MTDNTLLVDPVGGREFRLIRCLGEGGFGAVYLAMVRSAGGLQQQVAVKLLRPDVEAKNQAVDRLRDEAHVLASLRHPVILVAHDLVTLGDRVALVTEYVEGQDLREILIDRRAPIPTSALLDVVGQVASALDAAWTSLGIVHRDVKPANIRIGRHGNVKLMDFGIAISEVLARSAHTQGNIVMGSLSYLAPERFDIDEQPHPSSDVFALGCALFEGVTRARLFHRLDAKKLFALANNADVFGMYIDKQLSRPMPDGVRELLRGMFRLEPGDRPTAAEVAAVCDRLSVELPERISLRMWCRERRWPEPEQAPSPPRSGTPVPSEERPREPSFDNDSTEIPAGPAPLAVASPAIRAAVESPATGPTVLDPRAVLGDALLDPGQDGGPGATLAVELEARRRRTPPPAAQRTWWRVAAVSVVGASGATVAIVVLVVLVLALGIVWVAGLGRGGDATVPPLSADELHRRRPPALTDAVPDPAEVEPPAEPEDGEADEAPVTPPKPRQRRPRGGKGKAEAPAAPEPPAPAAPKARVGTADTWPIELRSGGSAHPVAAGTATEVPAGSYEVWVDFGRGMMAAGQVEVAAGAVVTVQCNAIRALCAAD